MRDWVTSIGLEASAYGTHSMRRTKVTQIYKKTGNLRAVQLLLGHTKMDSTVRYLVRLRQDRAHFSRMHPAHLSQGFVFLYATKTVI